MADAFDNLERNTLVEDALDDDPLVPEEQPVDITESFSLSQLPSATEVKEARDRYSAAREGHTANKNSYNRYITDNVTPIYRDTMGLGEPIDMKEDEILNNVDTYYQREEAPGKGEWSTHRAKLKNLRDQRERAAKAEEEAQAHYAKVKGQSAGRGYAEGMAIKKLRDRKAKEMIAGPRYEKPVSTLDHIRNTTPSFALFAEQNRAHYYQAKNKRYHEAEEKILAKGGITSQNGFVGGAPINTSPESRKIMKGIAEKGEDAVIEEVGHEPVIKAGMEVAYTEAQLLVKKAEVALAQTANRFAKGEATEEDLDDAEETYEAAQHNFALRMDQADRSGYLEDFASTADDPHTLYQTGYTASELSKEKKGFFGYLGAKVGVGISKLGAAFDGSRYMVGAMTHERMVAKARERAKANMSRMSGTEHFVDDAEDLTALWDGKNGEGLWEKVGGTAQFAAGFTADFIASYVPAGVVAGTAIAGPTTYYSKKKLKEFKAAGGDVKDFNKWLKKAPGIATAASFFATSAFLEMGSITEILGKMEFNGEKIDIFNNRQVLAALEDPETVRKLKTAVGLRAGVIGTVDMLTGRIGHAAGKAMGGLTNKFTRSLPLGANKTLPALGYGAGAIPADAALGGAGEALGQLAVWNVQGRPGSFTKLRRAKDEETGVFGWVNDGGYLDLNEVAMEALGGPVIQATQAVASLPIKSFTAMQRLGEASEMEADLSDAEIQARRDEGREASEIGIETVVSGAVSTSEETVTDSGSYGMLDNGRGMKHYYQTFENSEDIVFHILERFGQSTEQPLMDFLGGFVDALKQGNSNAIKDLKIIFASDFSQMGEGMGGRQGFYDPDANALYINSKADTAGGRANLGGHTEVSVTVDGESQSARPSVEQHTLASLLVHELSHFAEKFNLVDSATITQEYKNADSQVKDVDGKSVGQFVAWLNYDTKAAERALKDEASWRAERDAFYARSDKSVERSEWFAYQVAREVRGVLEADRKGLKGAINKLLNNVRPLINAMLGDSNLSTKALNDAITAMIDPDNKGTSTVTPPGTDKQDEQSSQNVTVTEDEEGSDTSAEPAEPAKPTAEPATKKPPSMGASYSADYNEDGTAVISEKGRKALDNYNKARKGKSKLTPRQIQSKLDSLSEEDRKKLGGDKVFGKNNQRLRNLNAEHINAYRKWELGQQNLADRKQRQEEAKNLAVKRKQAEERGRANKLEAAYQQYTFGDSKGGGAKREKAKVISFRYNRGIMEAELLPETKTKMSHWVPVSLFTGNSAKKVEKLAKRWKKKSDDQKSKSPEDPNQHEIDFDSDTNVFDDPSKKTTHNSNPPGAPTQTELDFDAPPKPDTPSDDTTQLTNEQKREIAKREEELAEKEVTENYYITDTANQFLQDLYTEGGYPPSYRVLLELLKKIIGKGPDGSHRYEIKVGVLQTAFDTEFFTRPTYSAYSHLDVSENAWAAMIESGYNTLRGVQMIQKFVQERQKTVPQNQKARWEHSNLTAQHVKEFHAAQRQAKEDALKAKERAEQEALKEKKRLEEAQRKAEAKAAAAARANAAKETQLKLTEQLVSLTEQLAAATQALAEARAEKESAQQSLDVAQIVQAAVTAAITAMGANQTQNNQTPQKGLGNGGISVRATRAAKAEGVDLNDLQEWWEQNAEDPSQQIQVPHLQAYLEHKAKEDQKEDQQEDQEDQEEDQQTPPKKDDPLKDLPKVPKATGAKSKYAESMYEKSGNRFNFSVNTWRRLEEMELSFEELVELQLFVHNNPEYLSDAQNQIRRPELGPILNKIDLDNRKAARKENVSQLKAGDRVTLNDPVTGLEVSQGDLYIQSIDHQAGVAILSDGTVIGGSAATSVKEDGTAVGVTTSRYTLEDLEIRNSTIFDQASKDDGATDAQEKAAENQALRDVRRSTQNNSPEAADNRRRHFLKLQEYKNSFPAAVKAKIGEKDESFDNVVGAVQIGYGLHAVTYGKITKKGKPMTKVVFFMEKGVKNPAVKVSAKQRKSKGKYIRVYPGQVTASLRNDGFRRSEGFREGFHKRNPAPIEILPGFMQRAFEVRAGFRARKLQLAVTGRQLASAVLDGNLGYFNDRVIKEVLKYFNLKPATKKDFPNNHPDNITPDFLYSHNVAKILDLLKDVAQDEAFLDTEFSTGHRSKKKVLQVVTPRELLTDFLSRDEKAITVPTNSVLVPTLKAMLADLGVTVKPGMIREKLLKMLKAELMKDREFPDGFFDHQYANSQHALERYNKEVGPSGKSSWTPADVMLAIQEHGFVKILQTRWIPYAVLKEMTAAAGLPQFRSYEKTLLQLGEFIHHGKNSDQYSSTRLIKGIAYHFDSPIEAALFTYVSEDPKSPKHREATAFLKRWFPNHSRGDFLAWAHGVSDETFSVTQESRDAEGNLVHKDIKVKGVRTLLDMVEDMEVSAEARKELRDKKNPVSAHSVHINFRAPIRGVGFYGRTLYDKAVRQLPTSKDNAKENEYLRKYSTADQVEEALLLEAEYHEVDLGDTNASIHNNLANLAPETASASALADMVRIANAETQLGPSVSLAPKGPAKVDKGRNHTFMQLPPQLFERDDRPIPPDVIAQLASLQAQWKSRQRENKNFLMGDFMALLTENGVTLAQVASYEFNHETQFSIIQQDVLSVANRWKQAARHFNTLSKKVPKNVKKPEYVKAVVTLNKFFNLFNDPEAFTNMLMQWVSNDSLKTSVGQIPTVSDMPSTKAYEMLEDVLEASALLAQRKGGKAGWTVDFRKAVERAFGSMDTLEVMYDHLMMSAERRRRLQKAPENFHTLISTYVSQSVLEDNKQQVSLRVKEIQNQLKAINTDLKTAENIKKKKARYDKIRELNRQKEALTARLKEAKVEGKSRPGGRRWGLIDPMTREQTLYSKRIGSVRTLVESNDPKTAFDVSSYLRKRTGNEEAFPTTTELLRSTIGSVNKPLFRYGENFQGTSRTRQLEEKLLKTSEQYPAWSHDAAHAAIDLYGLDGALDFFHLLEGAWSERYPYEDNVLTAMSLMQVLSEGAESTAVLKTWTPAAATDSQKDLATFAGTFSATWEGDPVPIGGGAATSIFAAGSKREAILASAFGASSPHRLMGLSTVIDENGNVSRERRRIFYRDYRAKSLGGREVIIRTDPLPSKVAAGVGVAITALRHEQKQRRVDAFGPEGAAALDLAMAKVAKEKGYTEDELNDIVNLAQAQLLEHPDTIDPIDKDIRINEKHIQKFRESLEGASEKLRLFKDGIAATKRRERAKGASAAKNKRAALIDSSSKAAKASVLKSKNLPSRIRHSKRLGQFSNDFSNISNNPAMSMSGYWNVIGTKANIAFQTMLDQNLAWSDRMRRGFDELADPNRRKFQDRAITLRRLQEDTEARAGNLHEQARAYDVHDLHTGKVGSDLYDIATKFTKPLEKLMHDKGLHPDVLDDWLHLLHAEERNKVIARTSKGQKLAGSGIPNHRIAQYTNEFKQDFPNWKDYDEAAQIVLKMNRWALEHRYKHQVISKHTYDQLKKDYPNYVPLRGYGEESLYQHEDHEFFESQRPRVGRGVSQLGQSGLRKARGLHSETVTDITAWSIALARQAAIESRKNEVMLSFYNLVRRAEALGHKIHRPARHGTNRNPLHYVNNTVGVLVNGVKKEVQMAPDRHDGTSSFARLLNDSSPTRASRYINIWMGVMRFLGAVNTTLNAPFIVSNFVRDMEQAFIAVHALEDEVKGNTRDLVKKVRKQAFHPKAIFGAIAGGALVLAEGDSIFEGATQFTQDWKTKFERFQAAGGKVHFYKMDTLHETAHELMRAVQKGSKRNPIALSKALLRFANVYNGAVENGVRASVFTAMVENGVSDQEAAKAARNLTVNFNRRGEFGTAISALYLFGNASIQGSARLLGLIAKSKAIRRIMGALFTSGFVMAVFNRLFGGYDEDEENRWESVLGYEKYRNVIVLTPGSTKNSPLGDVGSFKHPLPYGSNVPYAMGVLMEEAVFGNKPKMELAADFANVLVQAFVPLNAGDNLLQTFTPTVGRPFVEISQNTDTFGRPIAPKDNFDRDIPGSAQYYPDASELSKFIAGGLNDLSGGYSGLEEGGKAGLISVSPNAIDHLTSSVVGGAGRTTERTMTSLQTAMDGTFEISETPIVRRFVGGDPTGYNQDRYFKLVSVAKNAERKLHTFEYMSIRNPERREAERDFLVRNKNFYNSHVKQSAEQLKTLSDLTEKLEAAAKSGVERDKIKEDYYKQRRTIITKVLREARKLDVLPD